MPRPLPVPVRHALWRRVCKNQDAATIAAELGLAPRTVRRLNTGTEVARPSEGTAAPSEKIRRACGQRFGLPGYLIREPNNGRFGG